MARICKSKSKAKFSNEQIHILESMFENEARPELQLKQQMAAQLGLQARQVAIWFQNKRARSKFKMLSQEYDMLKQKYDDLASKFESLNQEKQLLLDQLQKLRNLIADQQGSSNCTVEQSVGTIHEDFENTNTNNIGEEKEDETSILLKGNKNENALHLCIDSTENKEYYYTEETDLFKFSDVVTCHHLTPCESWCNLETNFQSSIVFDEPMSSSQWWEY